LASLYLTQFALLCFICYVVLCYVMSCYVMVNPICVALLHLLCYVMLCYVMLCYVMLWSCHVMSCHVLSCHVMLCYTGISHGCCYPHMLTSIHAQTSSRDQCLDVASSPVSLWPAILPLHTWRGWLKRLSCSTCRFWSSSIVIHNQTVIVFCANTLCSSSHTQPGFLACLPALA
jgi:hypothetical protein